MRDVALWLGEIAVQVGAMERPGGELSAVGSQPLSSSPSMPSAPVPTGRASSTAPRAVTGDASTPSSPPTPTQTPESAPPDLRPGSRLELFFSIVSLVMSASWTA